MAQSPSSTLAPTTPANEPQSSSASGRSSSVGCGCCNLCKRGRDHGNPLRCRFPDSPVLPFAAGERLLDRVRFIRRGHFVSSAWFSLRGAGGSKVGCKQVVGVVESIPRSSPGLLEAWARLLFACAAIEARSGYVALARRTLHRMRRGCARSSLSGSMPILRTRRSTTTVCSSMRYRRACVDQHPAGSSKSDSRLGGHPDDIF